MSLRLSAALAILIIKMGLDRAKLETLFDLEIKIEEAIN